MGSGVGYTRERLGELLVAAGLVTRDQLEQALQVQIAEGASSARSSSGS